METTTNRYDELAPDVARLVDKVINGLASWQGHDVTLTRTLQPLTGAEVFTVRVADCWPDR